MEKYKESGNGEYIRIDCDEAGNELSRTPSWNKKNKPGYFQEMQEWKAAGNEIEPQFTPEELAAKEAEEAEIAKTAWVGERLAEYQKEGCTIDALIVALWEMVIEGRPEAAEALQTKRKAVKELIKKPE